ncbi:MAG: 5'/3'-nucleotidase SurE [Actinobacteria bacterium]|nr:5'/3'-nucleotidase SurE [Actinomycetota bacterium]
MEDPADADIVAKVAGRGQGSIPKNPSLMLTNDDGIDSPGLRMLAERLADQYDVVVAAPEADMSGSGTGIGRFDPRTGVKLRSAELGKATAYTVAGPPGLAVMAAALGAFGRVPDVVISGINAGMNTGHSVIHSGTVGAVLTARTFRIHGMAISLAESDPWQWETAVQVGERMVEWLLQVGDPQAALNVNVPAVEWGEIKGARWADLDSFGHFRVAVADDRTGLLQFEVAGADSGRDEESDSALCRDDYVTVTPLTTVERAASPPDNLERLFDVRSSSAMFARR